MSYQIETIHQRPDAEGFIYKSMMGVFGDSPHLGPVPPHMRWDVYTPIIKHLMEQDTCLIATVPRPENEKDVFLGFIIGKVRKFRSDTIRVIHGLYVKKKFRERGIGSRLVAELGIDPNIPFYYTFKPKSGKGLLRKFPAARYRPMMVRELHERSKDTNQGANLGGARTPYQNA